MNEIVFCCVIVYLLVLMVKNYIFSEIPFSNGDSVFTVVFTVIVEISGPYNLAN